MKLNRAAWAALAVAVTATVLACGADTGDKGGITEVAASPNATAAASAAAKSVAPKVKAWGAGIYKVGEDIAPGSYKTTGADGFGCYWERLKDDSGELNAVIANDVIQDGAPGRMTVKSSDKFVKFSGDCKWIKA